MGHQGVKGGVTAGAGARPAILFTGRKEGFLVKTWGGTLSLISFKLFP